MKTTLITLVFASFFSATLFCSCSTTDSVTSTEPANVGGMSPLGPGNSSGAKADQLKGPEYQGGATTTDSIITDSTSVR